jgi:hypothetical protein
MTNHNDIGTSRWGASLRAIVAGERARPGRRIRRRSGCSSRINVLPPENPPAEFSARRQKRRARRPRSHPRVDPRPANFARVKVYVVSHKTKTRRFAADRFYVAPICLRGQSASGLAHAKTLRAHAGCRFSRQRFGLRRPSAAFSNRVATTIPRRLPFAWPALLPGQTGGRRATRPAKVRR